MESYEQKYKEALGWMKSLYGGLHGKTKEEAEKYFPELKESEEEKIRKWIIDDIRYNMNNEPLNNSKYKKEAEKAIAWLKKQNKHQQLYIRFGDIPSNEKSKIYRGEEEIGTENGVSVYSAFEDADGNIVVGLNLPISKTSLHTQQYLIEYDNRPCYLVSGDYLGKGTDGEPLIKNVKIIKEIKSYRMKKHKENNDYIINNTPNCSISVYNEELKESEDERIRKTMSLEKQGIYKIWTNNDYDKVKSIEYLLHEFDNHNFDDWFNSLKKE